VQIRYRVTDWQWVVGAEPPLLHVPGPGPFLDRVRIGRVLLNAPKIGPGLDTSEQAQDNFPSELHPEIPLSAGEHFRPTTDRFGTADFSMAREIARYPMHRIVGDSIFVRAEDVRYASGVTTIEWYGAIVSGPHAGKAPAPWSVGSNGFFRVPADTVKRNGYIVENHFFVDLDDDYLRGGDVLHYFWLAEDTQGGVSSFPTGLTRVPDSIEEAYAATGGLLEVSILPSIDWDPTYLARIAADPHGKLKPTPQEVAGSRQTNCILYCQMVNPTRRTGDAQRTSFMYTLDRLGYRGHYDVYDRMGATNCYNNNHLGSRASVEQAEGYQLIIYDTGNRSVRLLPDGRDNCEGVEVDQIGWFRDWLTQAGSSDAGFATLWILGSDVMEEEWWRRQSRWHTPNNLFSDYFGVDFVDATQRVNINPDVAGQTEFFFDVGSESRHVDFEADRYSLNGGCRSQPDPIPPWSSEPPTSTIRRYDALVAVGSGVETHRYSDPWTGALGDAALVMNSSTSANWNTIFQSHPWVDIVTPSGQEPSTVKPRETLLTKILGAVLPTECLQSPVATDALGDGLPDTPQVTALHGNVPNPLNPTTTIRFDLARDGHVELRIYNVSGRLVRTLVNGPMERERHQLVWDGMDNSGVPVSSGIYFYRLETAGFRDTRKMAVLR
jgi:hypothetical protein